MTDQEGPKVDRSRDPLDSPMGKLLLSVILLAFLGMIGGAFYNRLYVEPRREAREADLLGAVDLRTDMNLAQFRQAFKGNAGLTTSTEVNACILSYGGVDVTFYCGRRKEDVRADAWPVRFYVRKPFRGTLHGIRLGDPRSNLDRTEFGANWSFQFTTEDDGAYATSEDPNSRLSSISLYHSGYRFSR